jgi:processive 1,2-diacylglycerol beta-glucosyltransferase
MTRTGGGHMNLAQSLKETLSESCEVQIADPYPDILHHYYAGLSRHFLWFWDVQYRFTNNWPLSYVLHSVLSNGVKRAVAALIEKTQPDLIISTHALLSFEVTRALKLLSKKIPFICQLTDLEEVHTAWFTEKKADIYLAPTREIHDQALREGVKRERLYAAGRPVRRQFLELDTSPSRRAETLTSLGLDPTMFTVFLQGGAKGSAGVDRTVKSILNAGVPIQIILAVGNNTTMAAHFSGVDRLAVLPFTEAIAPYLDAADVMVGKPGASFLTEAFTLEKPFIVTTFIPGQEAPNLRFIQRHNLGWVCLDQGKLRSLLKTLATDSTVMQEKITSIRAYKEWNTQARQAVLPVVEQLLTV